MLFRLWRRWLHGDRRIRQQPHWRHFAGPDWAERIMSVSVQDRLHVKQGRSIARWTLTIGERRLVVYLKRHYRLPRRLGLLAMFSPGGNWSPAFQEWTNLEYLRSRRLPVPRVAAAGQLLSPKGQLQSFLAVEELTDMLPLHEAIPLAYRRLSARDFLTWKQRLIGELVRLVRALHDHAEFHKDLYLCHFYLSEADTQTVPEHWPNRLVMIDLHRFGRHRWTWPWWQAKDLGQLLYSSDVPGVTNGDRLRFWRLYCEGRESWYQGVLRRIVQRRARNYRDKHRRRAK